MAPSKTYEAPAISPEKMSYGLMGGVSIVWLISLIVSISSLFSLTYIRLRTDLVKRNVVPSSCQPIPFNDYELVHIDCPVRTSGSFKVPRQFEGNVNRDDLRNAVFFDMNMEMFQNGKWYDHVLGSSYLQAAAAEVGTIGAGYPAGGGVGGKVTPYFPSIDGVGRQFSNEVYAGNFRLTNAVVPALFKSRKQLKLVDDGIFIPDLYRPPLKITNRNTHVFDNALYTATDPLHPVEGDLRIRFFVNSATHVSAIGVQVPLAAKGISALFKWIDRGINDILNPEPTRALVGFDDNYLRNLGNETMSEFPEANRLLIGEGDYNADQLIHIYENDNNAFHPIHWYALTIFGLSTTILAWSLIRRFGPMASFNSLPLFLIVGTFMTVGSVLLVASIPNFFMGSTLHLGILQSLAGFCCLVFAWWSYQRAPDLYYNSCLLAGPHKQGYVEIPTGRPYQRVQIDEGMEVRSCELPAKNKNKVYAAV